MNSWDDEHADLCVAPGYVGVSPYRPALRKDVDASLGCASKKGIYC